jgi:PAS domain S-box-containing protein
LYFGPEWCRVTLSSIGDAVITTDTNGGVTFLNPVAESMTGWTQEDAAGKSLDTVFKIINEETRHTVENPATRALREGVCRRAACEVKAG